LAGWKDRVKRVKGSSFASRSFDLIDDTQKSVSAEFEVLIDGPGKSTGLTSVTGLLGFVPVNLSGQQFARNVAGWYWFTKAADWRLRLH
jgi:hypothetical protein